MRKGKSGRRAIEGIPPVRELYSLAIREGNHKKPVYEIHKWWARRLGVNFRFLLIAALLDDKSNARILKEIYRKQSFPKCVVLDPFMGGGTTIVEASKMGMKSIGIDIDPVAWFVTKKELDALDEKAFLNAIVDLEESVGRKIKNYYRTTLSDGREVDVVYYFWVDLVTCPTCRSKIEGHPHFEIARFTRKMTKVVFCPYCHSIREIQDHAKSFACKDCGRRIRLANAPVQSGTFKCPTCGTKKKLIDLTDSTKPLPKRMFALEYWDPDEKSRRYLKARRCDFDLYEKACKELRKIERSLPFPRDSIPSADRSDLRPISHGHLTYSSLFNRRQLLCLSLLYRDILDERNKRLKEFLLIAFSDSLACNNMLCAYAFAYRKLTPLFGLHSYRHVNRPVEGNVWGTTEGRGSFTRAAMKLVRGKRYCRNPYEFKYSEKGEPVKVFTGETIEPKCADSLAEWTSGAFDCLLLNKSSESIPFIPDKSVDLVLTDPPYFNNLSYSELSDFYWVWLRGKVKNRNNHWKELSTPYRSALSVFRPTQSRIAHHIEGLTRIFAECKRTLRDDGIMVFTYHHNDARAWFSLATGLVQAGFVVVNVFPMLSEGRSGFHTSKGNIKWDCVLVCRKSNTIKKRTMPPNLARKAQNHTKRWGKRLSRCHPTVFGEVDSKSLFWASLVAELTRAGASETEVESLFSRIAADQEC